jgi:hypothetical protein
VANVRVAIVELDRFAPEKNAAVRALLAGAGLVAGPWGSPRDYCLPGGECTENEVFYNPRYEERRRGGAGRAWAPARGARAGLQWGTGVACSAEEGAAVARERAASHEAQRRARGLA